MQAIHSVNLIATDPAICAGRHHIIGRRITVADIVIVMKYHQQHVDGLASWFDLSLSEVHAALAFYYAHPDLIESEIRHQIRGAEQLCAELERDANSRLSLPNTVFRA